MMGLTTVQAQVLAYLKRYFADHGVMPSMDEIASEIGWASKSGACRVLTALEERGHIRRLRNRRRAIELVEGFDVATATSAELTARMTEAARELQRRGEFCTPEVAA